MSHGSGHADGQVAYAKIVDGVVVEVSVVSQADSAEYGAAFMADIVGAGGYWVLVDDDTGPIHHHFANIGDTWDEDAQAFYSPQPFPSWSLDDDFHWQAPEAYPGTLWEEPFYTWDEDTTSWVEVE